MEKPRNFSVLYPTCGTLRCSFFSRTGVYESLCGTSCSFTSLVPASSAPLNSGVFVQFSLSQLPEDGEPKSASSFNYLEFSQVSSE